MCHLVYQSMCTKGPDDSQPFSSWPRAYEFLISYVKLQWKDKVGQNAKFLKTLKSKNGPPRFLGRPFLILVHRLQKSKWLWKTDRTLGSGLTECTFLFDPSRTFCTVHDGTSGQWMCVFPLGADIKITCADPVSIMTAFFAGKSVGPLLFKQVLVTCFRIRKTLIKRNLIFGKIFDNRKFCHNGLLCSFEAIITEGCDRSGHTLTQT